jgi:hypothetical protein
MKTIYTSDLEKAVVLADIPLLEETPDEPAKVIQVLMTDDPMLIYENVNTANDVHPDVLLVMHTQYGLLELKERKVKNPATDHMCSYCHKPIWFMNAPNTHADSRCHYTVRCSCGCTILSMEAETAMWWFIEMDGTSLEAWNDVIVSVAQKVHETHLSGPIPPRDKTMIQ